ncbi:transposase [Streptomyces sp. NBC_00440]|uniref:transposase n=1 Tax=Streptomyces sp. NBC_00440 TaxID=2975741 RepID=UPI002E23CCA9
MAGKWLTGWIVIDLDATIITAASKKTGAAVTFKKTFGFHPLAAWCANTTESLAMLLRPGNFGSNTVADHLTVLTEALAQIPGSSTSKILVRVDGAGATHGLLEHLEALNTTRRTVRYTVGWKVTEDDEKAIAQLPDAAWETSVHQGGSLQEGYFVAELTGLNIREGWPDGMRLIVRRVKPTRRHLKKLTAFENKTGWRYCITATNIRHMWGIAGSGHSQFLDVLHRSQPAGIRLDRPGRPASAPPSTRPHSQPDHHTKGVRQTGTSSRRAGWVVRSVTSWRSLGGDRWAAGEVPGPPGPSGLEPPAITMYCLRVWILRRPIRIQCLVCSTSGVKELGVPDQARQAVGSRSGPVVIWPNAADVVRIPADRTPLSTARSELRVIRLSAFFADAQHDDS